MEPQRIDPFEGLLNFLKSICEGPPDRSEALTTKVNQDITIDTCLPRDTGLWETGIKRLRIEGEWIIIEQYPNKESARIGHEKWVGILKEYPDFPLKDINLWSIPEEELNAR